ncbi:putative zinc-binding dehydrogenase family protein [Neofusicoccum parvum UCRNP2]|uniref:Putative zinc-binding dehydrogenase family protein n=1 Tax=Botryosphaeria parva (strain UCR-NP2) TaxID=1287680 RepID=R1E7F5_BOTPV|nr:putative zinc-binding dehydrogenase family protein [Neofusicoccum parvum UCRNP2]
MSGVENELPSQQSAIVAVSRIPGRNLAVSHAAPLPALEPDQVLVKTAAVALNPCDWKMPDNFPSVGAVDGSDFAGTVVALGSAVDRPDLSVGDRVCGAVHGSNPADHRSGSFAEYVAATADILMKIPDGVPWEEGAAIGGTGIATLGLVFYEHMKIEFSPKNPAPAEKSFPVLIYGGGTATGTMATQLIRQ